jgi:hypothetical protein
MRSLYADAILGFMQKTALACGSMILYVFVCSFFTPQGEKRTDKKKNLRDA